MPNFSRRNFLKTAGITAGAVVLKGCLGNPPGENQANTNNPATTAATNISPEIRPETTTIRPGYIPIVEAAP